MSDINPSIPQVGEPVSTSDPKIVTALTTLVSTINALDTSNYADASVTKVKLATDALNAFLKLNTVADKKVEFGSATITCSSGGGTYGDADGASPHLYRIAYGGTSVTHGMGATPSYVFLTAKTGGTIAGGDCMISLSATAIGGTTFTANASVFNPTIDEVNGTVAVSWLAIA